MMDLDYFKKRVLGTLQSSFIVAVTGFLTTILIARALGPEKRGEFVLLTTIPSLIVTFGRFGISHSIVYNINKLDRQKVVSTSFMFALFFGITLLIFGAAISYFNTFEYVPHIDFIFLILSLSLIPLFFVTDVLYSSLQGINKLKERNRIYAFQAFVVLVFTALVALKYQEAGLIYFLLVQVIALTIIILILCREIGTRELLHYSSFSWITLKKLIKYGLKSHLGNLFKQLSYRVDVLVVAYFLSAKEVGLYTIAVAISELLWKFADAIGFVLLPTISSNNNHDSFGLTSKVSRFTVIPLLIISIIVIVFGDYLVLVLFGREYLAAVVCLKYLVPGTFFYSFWKIIVNDLIGRGKATIYSYSAVISAFVLICLDLLLIPSVGIIGASIATSIAYVIATLFVVVKFTNYSKMSWTDLVLLKRSELLKIANLLRH